LKILRTDILVNKRQETCENVCSHIALSFLAYNRPNKLNFYISSVEWNEILMMII